MRALLEFCLGKSSEAVYEALLAEVNQPSPGKGEARVSTSSDECIRIEIIAKDLSGLRALVNSYHLLVYASYSSIQKIEELER
ncbi:MAG: hypothetical protein GSR72_07880 [Desulfurococcales archaeon]|nr:hypothetical protein [Desulfurococcales archaeon]